MTARSKCPAHDPHRAIVKNNHLGLADYYCGICAKPLLKMTSVSDIDVPIPDQCPYCHEYVVLVGRQEKARPRKRKKTKSSHEDYAAAKERTRMGRKKRLEALLADPYDPKHGTPTGYSYGCRCDECRQAVNEYQRNRKR